MKRLTINLNLVVEGEDRFIELLDAMVSDKKSTVLTKDAGLSVWEYSPEEEFVSSKVEDF
jgi:hypothetical protein